MVTSSSASNPTLLVNEELISYIPGTLRFDRYEGLKIVETRFESKGVVTIVYFTRSRQPKSRVNISIPATQENVDLVEILFGRDSENVVQISDDSNGLSDVFERMTLKKVSYMEIPNGPDVTLEFESSGSEI